MFLPAPRKTSGRYWVSRASPFLPNWGAPTGAVPLRSNSCRGPNKPACLLQPGDIRSIVSPHLVAARSFSSHSAVSRRLPLSSGYIHDELTPSHPSPDLAKGLKASPPAGFGKMIQVNPDTFQKELADKTGVILFKCYWPRGNEYEETGSGGYIDLWDKDNITGGGMFLRSMYGFFGVLSDLSHSKQIWFWEVK